MHIIFFNFQKLFSFLSNAPYITKLKFHEIKDIVKSALKNETYQKNLFFFIISANLGILLFVLYISLLLKMINGFSWPAKIMASPFKTNHIVQVNRGTFVTY